MFEQAKVNLFDYGFTKSDFPALDKLKFDRSISGFIPARIIESQRDRYKVICEYGEVPAEIKGSFYHNLDKNESLSIFNEDEQFPVIGDFVLIKHNPQGSSLIGANEGIGSLGFR